MSRQFLKFLFAGGTAAVANIVSRIVFNIFVGYDLAIILAYLIGMVTAFLLTKIYVFEETGEQSSRQFGKFALVNMFAIAIVWGVSTTLARSVFPAVGMDFYPEDIAHIVGVGSTAITSYVLHKTFTFRQ